MLEPVQFPIQSAQFAIGPLEAPRDRAEGPSSANVSVQLPGTLKPHPLAF